MTVLLEPAPASTKPTSGHLRVALVNNMPDAAFEETEQQFRALLDAGTPDGPVLLARYVLPSVKRGMALREIVARGYRDVNHLYHSQADAVIVTGAEPMERRLVDESYWQDLQDVLGWCRSEVPAAYLSCLAAHAAVMVFDDIERQPLDAKCSGAFAQVVAKAHPLMTGIRSVKLPQSRWNDVPAAAMESRGYEVLAKSAEAGWALATAARGQCAFLLAQGHPEYRRLTLLREYRRDVRRYLSGQQTTYPGIPFGYLDPDGVALLEDYEAAAKVKPDGTALVGQFPFSVASAHVTADWRRASRALFKNWMRSVRHRAGQQFYTKKGA
jgi:homoserine O-succinyltransferase/O-acetyltransferase